MFRGSLCGSSGSIGPFSSLNDILQCMVIQVSEATSGSGHLEIVKLREERGWVAIATIPYFHSDKHTLLLPLHKCVLCSAGYNVNGYRVLAFTKCFGLLKKN